MRISWLTIWSRLLWFSLSVSKYKLEVPKYKEISAGRIHNRQQAKTLFSLADVVTAAGISPQALMELAQAI